VSDRVTTTTISPFVVSELQEVELTDKKGVKRKLWRKEILPSGQRKYKDQTLDFSKINPACVKAFSEGATGPSVPFVLPLADNKHPETGQEVETLEGELARLELGSNGELIGFLDLSHSTKVPDLIKKTNGKFGVSGRIEVDYTREDVGKKYDYALSHVCGTTRPHIKDLKPWELVDLSEEEKAQTTLDFSTEVIEEKPSETKETAGDVVALEIPRAQFDKLMAFIGDVEKGEEVANKLKDDDGNSGGAQLSEEATRRIELAETSAQEANRRIELAERRAAQSEWNARKRELALAGVPPVLLDLAEPVLSLHKRFTIQLSESETVDASEVLEQVLEAAKGTVKLNQEDGHSVTDALGTSAADKEFEEFQKNILAGTDY
jgi:hypothetical protein